MVSVQTENMEKRNILIIMGRYLPGYKDGGPVRTIKNLVDYLGEEYQFSILTCDRDHGDTKPYENIEVDAWNQVGKAKVYYVPPGGFSLKCIAKLSKMADLVYVCGCFNDYAINTMLLKRINIIKKPVVFATMGLFSPKEFQLKYKKKKLFTTVFNFLGMFKNIYFSATSKMEIQEVRQQLRVDDKQFFIAEDLPRMVVDNRIIKTKEKGSLSVVWISRIAEKKNLMGAIRILQNISAECEISFSIFGPVHSEKYWEKCQEELKKMPPNVRYEYMGNADSEQVVEILKNYHVFLFPTLGENYGHVIQEALSAGCVCILSDQTPWNDLENNNAGYVYALDNEKQFQNALMHYGKMGQDEFQKVSDCSLNYARSVSNQKVEGTGYRKIFAIKEDYM